MAACSLSLSSCTDTRDAHTILSYPYLMDAEIIRLAGDEDNALIILKQASL